MAVLSQLTTTMDDLAKRVTSLDSILSNKQARGVLGELQLEALLSDTLPTPQFRLQHSLSNGKRVDAFLNTGNGWVGIDSKFPLESYQFLVQAPDRAAEQQARKKLRSDVLVHIKDVADKYILPGETIDSAFLFVPAESVHAELHANHPDVIQDAMARRIWIVSPNTLMAALVTLRAMTRDAHLLAKADQVRREMSLLAKDVERLLDRTDTLNKALEQAQTAAGAMLLSARKSQQRAEKLATLDFDS
jgi:DNA recombination protein RmuC